MNKCIGCGATLQNANADMEGYIKENEKNKALCERCFRIQHYNEYKRVAKEPTQFIQNLEKIKQTNDLTILVVDLLNINPTISEIVRHCSKKLLLVLTKRDVLPLFVSDEKLKQYASVLGIQPLETLVISAKKNQGLDALYHAMQTYKTSKYVYMIGYTNAGKSTLVNHLIQHYSDFNRIVTTSMLSSTTLGNIEIEIDENLILVDTPGIIEEGNLCEEIDTSLLKKILPKKEIRPITYQIKSSQSIWIEQMVRIDIKNNDITLYFSNQLSVSRKYKKEETTLHPYIIDVKAGEDVVILGLGFFKVKKEEILTIYTLPNISIYTRKGLI